MKGKIIKGIAGFYYVHDGRSKIYECKAKGVFRNRNIKPLVEMTWSLWFWTKKREPEISTQSCRGKTS